MSQLAVSMLPTKFTEGDAKRRVEKCISDLRKGWFENPDYEVTEQPHQIHGIEWALTKNMDITKAHQENLSHKNVAV